MKPKKAGEDEILKQVLTEEYGNELVDESTLRCIKKAIDKARAEVIDAIVIAAKKKWDINTCDDVEYFLVELDKLKQSPTPTRPDASEDEAVKVFDKEFRELANKRRKKEQSVITDIPDGLWKSVQEDFEQPARNLYRAALRSAGRK